MQWEPGKGISRRGKRWRLDPRNMFISFPLSPVEVDVPELTPSLLKCWGEERGSSDVWVCCGRWSWSSHGNNEKLAHSGFSSSFSGMNDCSPQEQQIGALQAPPAPIVSVGNLNLELKLRQPRLYNHNNGSFQNSSFELTLVNWAWVL